MKNQSTADQNPTGREALFSLGQIVATPGALAALGEETTPNIAGSLIRRHVTGDWSDMDRHDQRANLQAIKEGTRVFSAYNLPSGRRFYVITEADRSSTTLLLPEEY